MNYRFKVAEFVGTVAYIGRIPIAPGTWGSLAALGAWYFLKPIIDDPFFLLITIIIYFIGIIVSEILVEVWKNTDPKAIVVDEWVGMWIALYLLPLDIIWGFIAFFFFRLFDILKPGTVQMMDDINSAHGIMLDDVVAGLLALFVTQGLLGILG